MPEAVFAVEDIFSRQNEALQRATTLADSAEGAKVVRYSRASAKSNLLRSQFSDDSEFMHPSFQRGRL